MPTRLSRQLSRRSLARETKRDSNASQGARRCSDSAQSGFPRKPQISEKIVPDPLDCGLISGLDEIEVGPIPNGVVPGQRVAFEYRGAPCEVEVPEGCGPGSYFRACVPKGFLEESSDASTCIGEADPSSDEDPMWSMDWTTPEPVPTTDALTHLDDSVEWSADCCLEQQLDSVAFENHVGCSSQDLNVQSPKRRDSLAEVFELSDWFTRLQQRREQALRSGKAKLVRKIDREIAVELEKSRQQDCANVPPAAHGDEYEEGIWAQDWSNLASEGSSA